MQTESLVKLYLDENSKIAKQFPVEAVVDLVNMITIVYQAGGKVFVFGNGGGASIAEHFASDLKLHPFVSEDKHRPTNVERLEVHCLNESNGVITRIANDIGYADIFSEQLKSYILNPFDIVIAFSTSGNSPNILKAMAYANRCGAPSVLIGGRSGGTAKELAELSILIPGTSKFPGQTGANDNNFHIEDFQASIAHIVTGLLREYVNHYGEYPVVKE